MPRLNNLRERHHQPYWDTLLRTDTATAANPVVNATTRLFATGTSLGLTQWTNMLAAGQLPSDQSYLVLSMRCWMWFVGLQALVAYQYTAHQLYLSLYMGDKAQFSCPAWYTPQGGGIWGFDSATPAMCNGVPQSESVLRFGKPIPMPPRQNFYVEANLYDTGATSVRTAIYNTAQGTPMKEVKVVLDGLHTRDVQ